MSKKLKTELKAGNTLTVVCEQPEQTFPPEVKRVKGFVKNGAGKLEPVLEDLPPAIQITQEVPESEKVKLPVDLNGKKPVKQKKSRYAPTVQEQAQKPKKTIQAGTLVTTVMLKKDNPKSYWNTAPGIKLRIRMIERNLKGELSGHKSSELSQKDAKGKIAVLQKQLKSLEGQ